jgi:hypothetical protein
MLDTPENIRDFVACVAYAMLFGAIEPANGSKFLYAAQVAYGAIKRQTAAPQPTAQCAAGDIPDILDRAHI